MAILNTLILKRSCVRGGVIAATLACLGVAAAAPAAHAQPSEPAPKATPAAGPPGKIVGGPGYVDLIYSRSYTKNTLQPAVQGGPAAVAGAAAALCGPGGAVLSLACGAGGAIYGAVSIGSINVAAQQNKCATLRLHYASIPTWSYWRVEDGPNCLP
ncbi:hypothetical protein ACTWJ8_02865 [Streptomyces sp. SDT5-1]|uniref:hypothetical protein n=1 Tax=Streptomyces sp. SDT5-1 TaxID=3406418 RepID=UPI003FD15F93